MRKVPIKLQPGCAPRVHRVVSYEDLAGEWVNDLHFLVLTASDTQRLSVERLQLKGVMNAAWADGTGIESGDVVVPLEAKGEALVLLRQSDRHHTLFMTNRCNSYCLMCSQPPTAADDGWLVEEAIDAIRHLGFSPRTLGLTGGEPLLLGGGLRCVLDAVLHSHPTTQVEVLTNGRLFAQQRIVELALDGLMTPTRWLVPLYGHADFVHDFVVQSRGAFDQTLAGLLQLRAYNQEIQLRVVLIEPVLQVLPELASFIGRNLPFVREVAIMGCEPIGFALANREICEVDLSEWGDALVRASRILNRHSVPHVFMNTPLCALPRSLWSSAHRSISDWKNVYAAECGSCEERANCSGLFAWHESGWKPAPLKSLKRHKVNA